MSDAISRKNWTLIWILGLAGQICWNVENSWFNTFVYAKIAKDPAIISWMVGVSAVVATLATGGGDAPQRAPAAPGRPIRTGAPDGRMRRGGVAAGGGPPMQKRIERPGPVLRPDGTLAERGYATRAVLNFNREAIKAPPWRIKEWDFYQVSNDRYCLQMTIGHVSYAGDVSVNLFEFATGRKITASSLLLLPFGRLGMPRSAEEGDLTYCGRGFVMQFLVRKGERRLICLADGRRGRPPVAVDIRLEQPDPTSIVMATPFDEDRRCFYYNQKINCMPASGVARFGDREYPFEPDSAFGLLDWGRGVWPFRHQWFWGNGSGWVNGRRFGFNIGWGFGNTEAATENVLFYDGTAHKLGHVYCDLAGGGYMARKRITSDDGRFDMEFTPIYDNYTHTKILFVETSCHQVWGRFNGRAVLDDGTVIEVKDLVAFVEHAVNRW
ncbi:MAG: DUF2804 domain-containing protein [Symbiobacterium sp.]|uniref:DUF2804 domain-containing protein n=1 Tax=Symbiobacterium sp. TaxID=1971213 RepID=UPI003464C0C3